MKNKEEGRFIRIIETGIHYNLALLQYEKQLAMVYELEELLPDPSHLNYRPIIESIERYLYSFEYRDAIQFLNKQLDPALVEKIEEIKKNLMLPWPLLMFFNKIRSKFCPKYLLEIYFKAHEITNGFNNFESNRLDILFKKLHVLEEIREKNYFDYGRVQILKTQELPNAYSVPIYYDKNKTSLRQALILLDIKVNNDDVLRSFIPKPLTLKECEKGLIALCYSLAKENITKDKYFETLMEQHEKELKHGHQDIRIIDRGLDMLKRLDRPIKELYEINEDDKVREEVTIGNSQKKDQDFINQFDPIVLLKATLSIFINYYVYNLSNVSFFKELINLKRLVKDDLKNEDISKITTITASLLNSIYRAKSYKPDDEILKSLEEKYEKELVSLRSYPIDQNYWGSIFLLVPSLEELIRYLVCIREKGDNNFQNIKHDYLVAPNDTHTYPKKAASLKRCMPFMMQEEYIVGLGYSFPPQIIVWNTPPDTCKGIFRAAVIFFDNQFQKNELSDVIIDERIEKLEQLLWGVFYLYQLEFSDVSLAQSKCIEIISEYCGFPISESRFKSGIKAAKNILESNKSL